MTRRGAHFRDTGNARRHSTRTGTQRHRIGLGSDCFASLVMARRGGSLRVNPMLDREEPAPAV